MYTFTTKFLDCFAAKRAMRSHLLKNLRSWALSYPDERERSSNAVCDTLFNYLYNRYLFSGNSEHARYARKNRETAKASAMPLGISGFPMERRQLYVCATLPLYYEVNLLPLLERLWSWSQLSKAEFKRGETSNSAIAPTEVYVMVPVVVDPNGIVSKPGKTSAPNSSSAHFAEWHYPIADAHERLDRGMVFVELYDAKDLRDSFEIRGPLKLCELKTDEFESFFVRRNATGHGCENRGNGFPGMASHNPRHPRKILPCEDWGRLFPEHLSPLGLVRLGIRGDNFQHLPRGLEIDPNNNNRESIDSQECYPFDEISEVSNVDVVVLAPGVCFQRLRGLRLGKGGGFYDRFLNHLRQLVDNNTVVSPPAPEKRLTNGESEIYAGKHLTVEAIGVAFDQQVLSGDEKLEAADSLWECVNSEDAHVDAIVAPSSGIKKIDYIDPHRFHIREGGPLHFSKIHVSYARSSSKRLDEANLF